MTAVFKLVTCFDSNVLNQIKSFFEIFLKCLNVFLIFVLTFSSGWVCHHIVIIRFKNVLFVELSTGKKSGERRPTKCQHCDKLKARAFIMRTITQMLFSFPSANVCARCCSLDRRNSHSQCPLPRTKDEKVKSSTH